MNTVDQQASSSGALPQSKEHPGILWGLFAISASTILLEIALTKFLAFKLFHHMTFAVLSMVILSFGASGILTYTNPRLLGLNREKPWSSVGFYAALYAISIAIVIPLISWLPLSPYDPHLSDLLRSLSLPMLFGLLAVPFFSAGVCISQTLALSSRKVSIIYFWDLLAAAVGAASCPGLLVAVGGFGTVAVASFAGLISALGYWLAASNPRWKTNSLVGLLGLIAICGCLFYPSWAIQKYGIDIRSFKEIGPLILLKDFGGIQYTQWNAIARVDISKTGTSQHLFFRWGLPPSVKDRAIQGRYVMLDGGCNTKQFERTGDIGNESYLGHTVQAAPWIAKPGAKDAIILGGGGGIDVLVAKYMKIPHVKVAEINPAVYAILVGQFDPKHQYHPWLKSDTTTKVEVYNEEARHFTSIQKAGAYDVIQASGVDTHTAIQSGRLTLVENYLYTVEAIKDYVRLLKPGGLLSIGQVRTQFPLTSTRMFLTYVHYLNSIGVKDPWRYIFVVGTAEFNNMMLQTEPFTEQQLNELRAWAKESGLSVVFDPAFKDKAGSQLFDSEHEHWDLAFLDQAGRDAKFRENPEIPAPVHDDKPYFFQFKHVSILKADSSQPTSLVLTAWAFSLFFLLIPIFGLRKQGLGAPVVWSVVYFLCSGFAFLLFETAIMQLFSIFVGGPTYSLMVVLVTVLGGYSLGSWLASLIKPSPRLFALMGLVLGALFIGMYFTLPSVIALAFPLHLTSRLIVAGSICAMVSAIIGCTVSLAMEVIRRQFGDAVSWMWGISCIANALGSISFVAITQNTGIRSCLVLVAVLYLVANLIFSTRVKMAD